MIQEITTRRSIRKYKTTPVPQKMIEEIIKAGMAAPSSKNRQPWKFIVVTGNSKTSVLNAFQHGIEREKLKPLLPESAPHLRGAIHTLEIMRQAPVLIFIANTLGTSVNQPLTSEERISEICNTQSIGAAIENMTLEAAALGLGSLWICDTYFAHQELCDWLQTAGELCAALAVGYPDEFPSARPRKSMKDVVEWRD